MSRRTVAVLLFDEVEVLDFAGPFEVFSVAGRVDGLDPFSVFTVTADGQPIRARNDLEITPHHGFDSMPAADVLVVPGGYGTRRLLDDRALIDWIARQAARSELVLSVCTGALLLARAGLLRERPATTHHLAEGRLREIDPTIELRRERVVVGDGMIVAAGVSAGIDGSFEALSLLCGREMALSTARYIEYRWEPA